MHIFQPLIALRDRLAYKALHLLDRFLRRAPARLTTTRCANFPAP